MRIAFISYWTCPRTRLGVLKSGGMNVYLFNLANALNKLNVHVDIFTRCHREKHESVVYLNKRVCLIHLPINGNNHYYQTQVFAQKVLRYIKGKNLKYNLLHAHYFYSGLSALTLKDSLNIPLIQSFHTLAIMKQKYAGILDPDRIKAEKEIVIKSDALLAATEFEKQDLVDYYRADPRKIYVINPGVNRHIFKPLDKNGSRQTLKLPLDKNLILFVGRIDPIKGLNLLLEAVSRLSNKHSDFRRNNRLLIIGGDLNIRSHSSDREGAKILKVVRSKNMTGFTEFLGSRPHNRLPLYYSAADVIVLPSVYESFGLVILEAFACASCVLASAVGGLEYLVKDGRNGRLFKNGSINDLSSKLNGLITDGNVRKKLSTAAYKTSRKFNWEDQAVKIVSLYKKLSQA